MKTKVFLSVLLTLTLLAALLAGCGAQASSDAYMQYEKSESAAVNEGIYDRSEVTSEDSSQSNGLQNQKLIRTLDIDAETTDMDTLLTDIDGQVNDLGGYVESRRVNNGSSTATTRYRYAYLTIRVPVENLNAFVQHVSDASNVTASEETAKDVTLSYVATQSRITALETEQARLLELLAQAENMEDLLQIESRLTDVRTELEEVTSQLRLYENLVDYGTIHLNLTEVRQLTPVVSEKTVWQRMGEGFNESLKNLGNGIVEFCVWIVVNLPYLLVWFLVGGIAAVIAIRSGKKRAAKRSGASNQNDQ